MTQIKNPTASPCDTSSIVETALQEIKNFATLPMVALKILELDKDPNSTAEDINRVITSDSALSIRILKIVNSSFYGLPRQIDSIKHAIQLLGFNAVKNIAIASGVHKAFPTDRISPHFDSRYLWTHSLAVATGARIVAATISPDLPDKAFLAGLIHDVGVMVEMQACRPKFMEIIQLLSDDQSLTLRQAEKQLLGVTHESFGAGLCRKWKFPVHLEFVAGCHHQPMQLPEEDRTLPAIVHVADTLADRVGASYPSDAEIKAVEPEVLSLLNLLESDLDSIAKTLPEAIQETQQLLAAS